MFLLSAALDNSLTTWILLPLFTVGLGEVEGRVVVFAIVGRRVGPACAFALIEGAALIGANELTAPPFSGSKVVGSPVNGNQDE